MWRRLVKEARKTRLNMLLCRVSCVGILARSSCTLSMQKFEIGEMYIVGRPTRFFSTNCDFFIRCDDFESDYNLYVLEVSLSYNIS